MFKEKLKYTIEIVLLIGLFLGYYYYINPSKEVIKPVGNIEENLKIYFIDVGQADSTLIYNNGEYSLIDAGNNKDGNKLIKYFKSLGINKFKYVITTHVHEDHIGGMDNIIREFDIEHFLMPDTYTDNMTYTEVLKELKKKNIIIETPNINDTFTMEEINFKVLSIGNDLENLNDSSIVLKANYKNTNYLFTGDATKEVEKKIMNQDIQSDLIKVSHHGSYDATGLDFLEKVNPKYAIISVEKDNDYHFPHDIVLNNLNKLNIKIYRTDLDGTIIASSDGDNIIFEKIKTDTNQK
ncbi:MAG: MBL fold metallo-hydrolase [Bacilli bacterium]|nr:MBL fold metallo-hydrolase [Bacilli bacterium]